MLWKLQNELLELKFICLIGKTTGKTDNILLIKINVFVKTLRFHFANNNVVTNKY